MMVSYFQGVREMWMYILLVVLLVLSIYFIFRENEILGIGLLIMSALLDYQLKRIKKNDNSHQPSKP